MTHELGGRARSPYVARTVRPTSATMNSDWFGEHTDERMSRRNADPAKRGNAKAVGSNALGCRRALVMQARKVPRSLTSKRLSDLTLAPLLSMLRCVWLFGDHRGPPTCRDNA